jgi:hypothetical protein
MDGDAIIPALAVVVPLDERVPLRQLAAANETARSPGAVWVRLVVIRRCCGRRRPVNVGQLASVGGSVISCCGGRIGGAVLTSRVHPSFLPPGLPRSSVLRGRRGRGCGRWPLSPLPSGVVGQSANLDGGVVSGRDRHIGVVCTSRALRGLPSPPLPSSIGPPPPPPLLQGTGQFWYRHERAVPLTCHSGGSEIALEWPGTPVEGGVSVGGRENTPVTHQYEHGHVTTFVDEHDVSAVWWSVHQIGL